MQTAGLSSPLKKGAEPQAQPPGFEANVVELELLRDIINGLLGEPAQVRGRAGLRAGQPRAQGLGRPLSNLLRESICQVQRRGQLIASDAEGVEPRCSAGICFSPRRAHAKESCRAEGGAGTGGLAALRRSRRFPATPSRFVTNA